MAERTKLVMNAYVGVLGTATASVSSMSVEEWAHVAAILAGVGTFAWMLVQCFLALRQRVCFREDCANRIVKRE